MSINSNVNVKLVTEANAKQIVADSYEHLKEVHQKTLKGNEAQIEGLIFEYLLPRDHTKPTIAELHTLVVARDMKVFKRNLPIMPNVDFTEEDNANVISLNYEQRGYIIGLYLLENGARSPRCTEYSGRLGYGVHYGGNSGYAFSYTIQPSHNGTSYNYIPMMNFHALRMDFIRQQETLLLNEAAQSKFTFNPVLFAELLSIEGIDINAKDIYGRTALFLAVEHQNLEAVSTLLRVNGIKTNIKNDQGETPLSHAQNKLKSLQSPSLAQDPEYDNYRAIFKVMIALLKTAQKNDVPKVKNVCAIM